MREINAESLVESAGSGWQGVYGSLSRDGFRVSIAQNPTLAAQIVHATSGACTTRRNAATRQSTNVTNDSR